MIFVFLMALFLLELVNQYTDKPQLKNILDSYSREKLISLYSK